MVKKFLIIIISTIVSASLISCKGITINFDDDSSQSSTTSSSSSISSDSSSSESTSSSTTRSSSSDTSNSSAATASTNNSSANSQTSNANNTAPDKTQVTVNIHEDNNYYSKNPIIPQFVYYSNSFIFPNSSNCYLSSAEVSALNNYQLGIARNEIYARHGYTFDLAQFRNYFNSQAWYTPIGKNVHLNKIEEYNVGLIKAEEDRRGVKW